ncbi:hypothetical protein GM160_05920 [Guyparkeria halophila]|uniref:Adhesin n=1 Tax=Guyparkeria halophila TaxID=47960 RepID=A0A6I6D2Q8_9GAMM|nr:hypothetical protein [Guyparkeria halophila]QGT78475.1 hypothetical protein GM160_05920 [Guyparkeria halophila]
MASRSKHSPDFTHLIRFALVGLGLFALAMTAQMIVAGDARAEASVPGEYDWMLAVLNDNHIGQRFAQGATGNVSVNTAAGAANLQTNQRALNGTIDATQRIDNPGQARPAWMETNTRIDGQAFSRGQGVLGVNQVAGDGNAQINSMALAPAGKGFKEIRTLEPVNPVGASDSAARDDGQSGEVSSGRYRAVVTDTAFSGFGGVLQINQVSGSRNVTANHFSMSGHRP